jgi:hypothetical protein
MFVVTPSHMLYPALNSSQVLYDADGELKVLLVWSANTVLFCFRGSTTAANWVADAMVSCVRQLCQICCCCKRIRALL